MSKTTYGAKFDDSLDIVEIAARVRADIKEAVKAGDLPRGKYRVRTERYSMGQSLRVSFNLGASWDLFTPEWVAMVAAGSHDRPPANGFHTAETCEVEAKLEAIAEAYNFDGSDPASDYYNVNFYLRVSPGWSSMDRQVAERASKPANAHMAFLAAMGVE